MKLEACVILELFLKFRDLSLDFLVDYILIENVKLHIASKTILNHGPKVIKHSKIVQLYMVCSSHGLITLSCGS